MQIEHQQDRQRFATTLDGHGAELDYRLDGDVLVVTHTGVPAAIAGRGIAGALMQAAVDFAKAAGLRVRPACSYAASWMDRHREHDGLRA